MPGATYGTAIRIQDHDDGYDEASKHPPIRLDHSAVIWNFLRRPMNRLMIFMKIMGPIMVHAALALHDGELTVSLYIMARGTTVWIIRPHGTPPCDRTALPLSA